MSSRALPPAPQDRIEYADLQRENDRLHARIRELEATGERLQLEADEAKRVLKPIRKLMEPFHTGFQVLFGLLDAAGVEATAQAATSASAPAQSNAKWESWKKNLPGRPAEFIDLLLVHGEMTTAQLMAAAKCAKQTVYDVTHKMTKAGILTSAGGKYSLKDL